VSPIHDGQFDDSRLAVNLAQTSAGLSAKIANCVKCTGLLKTADGRVLFAVAWHDCVIVGITDTPLTEKSLEPRALESEVDFIMEHAAKYLTKDREPEDVQSIFAGLRPLVSSGDSSDTAAISRDHTIVGSNSGLITVTGEKWTTYRKMAGT